MFDPNIEHHEGAPEVNQPLALRGIALEGVSELASRRPYSWRRFLLTRLLLLTVLNSNKENTYSCCSYA